MQKAPIPLQPLLGRDWGYPTENISASHHVFLVLVRGFKVMKLDTVSSEEAMAVLESLGFNI